MAGARKKFTTEPQRAQRITEKAVPFVVTPAKAGVHIPEAEAMDPGFRRGDIEFSTEFRVNKAMADIGRRSDEPDRQ